MEQEFDLSKAVSGQAKAMADREFYMSMVAQNTPGASPLAAYLAGMASAKASQYEGQIQADKDARDAASKALKRQDALRDTVYQLMGDVATGKMQPSAAAMMLEPTMKEMGYRMVEYDADRGIATFADAEGEEYEVTMDQVPDKYKIISEEGQTKREEIKAQSRKEVEEIKAQSKKEVEEIKSGSGGGSRGANVSTTFNAWVKEYEETPVIDKVSYPTSVLQAALKEIESAPEQWKKENYDRVKAKLLVDLAKRKVTPEGITVLD